MECWRYFPPERSLQLADDKHVIIFTRDTITGVLGGCSIITRSVLAGAVAEKKLCCNVPASSGSTSH